jgi:DNA-3-methyladenine glycosylase I
MPVERCPWPKSDLMIEYHDAEWGVPSHDDRHLFEHLTLEGAQAGLNWELVLKKREGYRKAFADYDLKKIAAFDDRKVEVLTKDAGIVRNRLKIRSVIANAQAAFKVQAEFGSLDAYLWGLAGGKPRQNAWTKLSDLPAVTPGSERISMELKSRGFRFVGPTGVYAFMQSAGMVNDHLVSCFRYPQIKATASRGGVRTRT